MLNRPRRARRLILIAAGAVVGLAMAGFAVVYFVIFPTSSPKPLTLSKSAVTVPVSPSSGGLAGRWTVATGSVAGYRVREKLGFLPAEDDAVGRTSNITGAANMTKQGQIVTVTAASFRVAVNTLKSDQAMRDQHIHTIGLQSDLYPTATFKLTKPVVLPASALGGSVVRVPVTGVFNIHGTARTETLPVELRLSSSSLEAAGSLTFPWSAFDMTAPSVGGFVSVEDKATMEFDLRLNPA